MLQLEVVPLITPPPATFTSHTAGIESPATVLKNIPVHPTFTQTISKIRKIHFSMLPVLNTMYLRSMLRTAARDLGSYFF